MEADITGLKGGTTYYVRLTIFAYPNEAVSSAPYLTFTTLPVEPPTISLVNDASEVFSRTATVAGKVKRPANPDPAFNVTACRFEYVTDAQFTATGFQGAASRGCEFFNPITAPGEEEEVGAELEGLTPVHHLPPASRRRKRRAGQRHQRSRPHLHHRSTGRQTGRSSRSNDARSQRALRREIQRRSRTARRRRPRPRRQLPLRIHHRREVQRKRSHSQPGFEGAAVAPCRGENPIESQRRCRSTRSPPKLVGIIGQPPTTYASSPKTTVASAIKEAPTLHHPSARNPDRHHQPRRRRHLHHGQSLRHGQSRRQYIANANFLVLRGNRISAPTR